MTFVDPECQSIVSAFSRRDLRARLPDSISARDPMYRRSGSSFNLKSIREYQSFDDPRAIDWRLYGRSERAYIKEFFDEADDELAFLLDTSASMACAPVDAMLAFVGSIAFIALSLGLGVRIWTYADGLSARPVSARSRSQFGIIERFLGSIAFAGPTDTMRSYTQWRSRGRQRRVLLVSDLHEVQVSARAAALRAPASGSLFIIRYLTPFPSLAWHGAEFEVRDPESGALSVVPWNAPDEARWVTQQAGLDDRLAALPRTFYRRLDGFSQRTPVYWSVLERLYA